MKRSFSILPVVIAFFVVITAMSGCKGGKSAATGRLSATSSKTSMGLKTTGKAGSTVISTAKSSTMAQNDVIDTNAENSEGAGSEEPIGDSDSGKIEEERFDLGGRTVKIVVMKESNIPAVGTSRGYVRSQKQYDNEKIVERELNCSIEWDYWKDTTGVGAANEFAINYMAGIKYADLINLYTYNAFPNLVNNNMIYMVDDFVDFNEPPYDIKITTQSIYKGRYWGLPKNSAPNGSVIAYNVDILDREGLVHPYDLKEQGNWTWETFQDIAIKTTRDLNGDAITDQWGYIQPNRYDQLFNMLMETNDASYLKYENGKYEIAFTDPQCLRVMDFLNTLAKVHKVVSINAALFNNGQAAMIYSANPIQGGTMPARVDSTLLPRGPDSKRQNLTTYLYPDFFVIPKNTDENPKALVKIHKIIFALWDPSNPNHVPTQAEQEDWWKVANFSPRSIESFKQIWSAIEYPNWLPFQTFLMGKFRPVIDTNIFVKNTPIYTAFEEIRPVIQAELDRINVVN